MSPEEAIKLLEQELYFEPRTALAYVRAYGHCEYCDRKLIFDRLGYACAEIDHLLPRALYPDEITGMSENFVLSCSLCNGTKRDAQLLKLEEDPEYMLLQERAELVQRARELIDERLIDSNIMWERAKKIFKELNREVGDN